MPRSPTTLALIALALLAVPTAWLAHARVGMQVDLENRAMKAIGTREADALHRRVAGFGADHALVLLVRAPAPAEEPTTSERDALDELSRALERAPAARRVETWPTRNPGARAFSIELALEAAGGLGGALEALEALAREAAPEGWQLAIGGVPAAEVAIARGVRTDQARVVPLVVGVLALLLFATWRSVAAVVAVLGPAALGIVWTGGLAALLGRELDPIAVLLEPVLLTVGVAGGVHFVEAYQHLRAAGATRVDAARGARVDLVRPTSLAATTTIAGFLSLALNPIPAVADFGVLAACGTALTFVASLVLTPLLLASLERKTSDDAVARCDRAWSRFARVVSARVERHARALRWLGAAACVAGLALWTTVEVDNDPGRVLPANHAFRQDVRWLAEELGGAEAFDVLVPHDSGLAEPARLALFAAAVYALPGIAGPTGPARVAANEDLALGVLLAPSGSARREALFADVEQLALAFDADEVALAGVTVQIARDSARLIRGQMAGIALTLALIGLAMRLASGKHGFALIAMLANLLPCVALYGGLGLAGRPVSLATAMIGSVLLGLVVDDAIHVLYRFGAARDAGDSVHEALVHAHERAGRSVVITSLALAGGFACGLFGALSTSREFGVLAAGMILVALLTNLIWLPALLLRADARRCAAEECARG